MKTNAKNQWGARLADMAKSLVFSPNAAGNITQRES